MFRLLVSPLLVGLTSAAWSLDAGEARHLLARTGFGPTADEIANLLPLSREDAVTRLVTGVRKQPVVAPPPWCAQTLAENVATRAEEDALWRDLPQEERQKHAQQREQRDRQRGLELKAWWYREMIATDSPLTERMTLFWHNHFTSSLTTVGDPLLMYEQNRLFRSLAGASFTDLLTAISSDPAMYIYLDSNSNINDRPNENFAREVMELFTVGEGFYSEIDIKEAARALSGYKIDDVSGRPVLTEAWHDTGWKTIFGSKGLYDADGVMTLLLERQERVAIHLCEKLWQDFIQEDIADPQTQREIYAVAGTFYRSHYDLSTTLTSILLHPRFWDPSNRGTLIRSPVDLLVGTVRQLDLPVPDATRLVEMGRSLGQDLLDPPNVKGWKGGSAWISTQGLLARRSILEAISHGALGAIHGTRSPQVPPSAPEAAPGAGTGMAAPAAASSSSTRPLHGGWIDTARTSGAEGILTAERLLLPLAPVVPIDAHLDFTKAIAQIILDPTYDLK